MANGHGISTDRWYNSQVTVETDPGDLCTQCGLCCSGALFDFGPLAKDEVEGARDAGLAILEADGKFGFGLPCPQLEQAVCQVYQARPQTCRTFRCITLRAHEAGEITFDEGMERIEQARNALAEIHAQLPDGATITDARRWRREAGKAEATDALNASPMLMMALGMLDVVLDQHFRRPDQRQIMPVD